MSQLMLARSASRVMSARPRPNFRALSRRSGGRRFAVMAMKTRLSMPRTISSAVSVRRLAQIPGSRRKCIGSGGLCRFRRRVRPESAPDEDVPGFDGGIDDFEQAEIGLGEHPLRRERLEIDDAAPIVA